MQQRVVVEQLLPLAPISQSRGRRGDRDRVHLRAVGPGDFRHAAQRLVESQVLRALLESNAAFYAAQMTAMDAATRNSSDMIDDLTLTMNKVRQAAITREIIEVVSWSAGAVESGNRVTGKSGNGRENGEAVIGIIGNGERRMSAVARQ